MPGFVQPTFWKLDGGGIHISYSTAGPHLHYHHGPVIRDFTGSEVRVVPVADLGKSAVSDKLRKLLQFEGARARQYYRESAPLLELIHARSRPSLRALIGIYSRLLDKIEAAQYEVLAQRVRVPNPEKVWILVRSRLAGG